MPLLGGRRTAALTDDQVQRVAITFSGLDPEMRNVRHVPGGKTVFRVVPAAQSDAGEAYGEIVFGPDIYPGPGVVHPNSVISMAAAAAHELAHYHRWHNATQLDDPALVHLDEALTSLEAVQRYGRTLSPVEVEQLVGDAVYRVSLHLEGTPGLVAPAPAATLPGALGAVEVVAGDAVDQGGDGLGDAEDQASEADS